MGRFSLRSLGVAAAVFGILVAVFAKREVGLGGGAPRGLESASRGKTLSTSAVWRGEDTSFSVSDVRKFGVPPGSGGLEAGSGEVRDNSARARFAPPPPPPLVKPALVSSGIQYVLRNGNVVGVAAKPSDSKEYESSGGDVVTKHKSLLPDTKPAQKAKPPPLLKSAETTRPAAADPPAVALPLEEDPMPIAGGAHGEAGSAELFEAQRQWLARRTRVLPDDAHEAIAAAIRRFPTPDHTNAHNFVVWTLSDAGNRGILLNWARHLEKLRVPHVIAALDEGVHRALVAEGTPTYLLRDYAALRAHIEKSQSAMTALNSDAFHRSASWQLFETQRIGGPRALVHAGHDVLLSDTDVVWLRDPRPFLYCDTQLAKEEGCELLKNADVMISSDRMSAKEDDEGLANYAKHGTLNTGIVFLRSTDAGRLVVAEWYRHLQERDGIYKTLATDQQVFNAMVDGFGGEFYLPEAAAMGEPMPEQHRDKVALLKKYPSRAFSAVLKDPPAGHEGEWPPLPTPCAILPLRYFANGHQYFVQRLQDRGGGGVPYCAHATYTGAGVDGTNHASKSTRFKEAQLWLVGDDYQNADEEKYLTWEPQLSAELRSCAGHADCTRAKPCTRADDQCPFACHARVTAHQLAQFRGAAGLARALGRTLVFPPLLCHCDRAWDGHGETIQQCCKYTGAEREDYLPMEKCPWDLLLPRNKMLSDEVKWREVGFLEGPFAPHDASESAVVVEVVPRGQDEAGASEAGKMLLPAGASAAEAVASLGSSRVRVLHVRGAQHAFCGFAAATDDVSFDALTHGAKERHTSNWFTRVDGEAARALEPAKSLLDPHPNWCSEVNKPWPNCTQVIARDWAGWKRHANNSLHIMTPCRLALTWRWTFLLSPAHIR